MAYPGLHGILVPKSILHLPVPGFCSLHPQHCATLVKRTTITSKRHSNIFPLISVDDHVGWFVQFSLQDLDMDVQDLVPENKTFFCRSP